MRASGGHQRNPAGASLLVGVVWCAASHGQSSQVDDAAQMLQARYASVARLEAAESGIAYFGSPTVRAATEIKAASVWLAAYAASLGVDQPDLRKTNEVALRHDRRVLHYRQSLDGLPVEYGTARLVVQDTGREHVVTYVAGSLVSRPIHGFARDRIGSSEALRFIRADVNYAHLTQWTRPRLVIFDATQVPGVGQPVRAWKFSGLNPRLDRFEGYTFFVDADSGLLVETRNEVYNAAVAGVVLGRATPSTLPDGPNNPPVAVALEDLTIFGDGVNVAQSGADGSFLFDPATGGPVVIDVGLVGPWVHVRNAAGSDLRLTTSATDGDFVELTFNESPAEPSTAQVNGFVHTVMAHNFYTDRAPGFTRLDLPLDCNVNIDDECNAFFTPLGLSINFFRSGSCVNSAYSSVIAHEYGHFILDRLGLRQGSFGEGFADALAVLIYDDPLVGRDFLGEDRPVRDYTNSDRMYPCFGEIHACGEVLGGIWWLINGLLQRDLGSVEGLAVAQRLFVDWSQITIGIRLGRNSATPLTGVEVLTADDDDGDLSNGTPHLGAICDAFVAHGIPCQGLCGAVRRVSATCRTGSMTVRATVATQLPPETELTLVLDGANARTILTNRFGRGSTVWRNVAAGDHKICIADCPEDCAIATCNP